MPYIGRSTDGFGVRNRFLFVADASDTSVSGADANGATLTFTDGAYVDVYLNGVLLKAGTDYNTNTANTIAGLSALSANDEVTVLVYDVFSVADTVSATSGGTFSGAVTLSGGVSSSLTVANNLTLTNGDIVFGTAGKGINLGVTSNTDSNTLDDYEEGTYTVTLTCGTSGTVTLKSSNNTGRYTKIGRVVYVNCDARVSSVSSPSGSMIFSLPFTTANTNSDEDATIGHMITHGTTKQSGQVGNFFPIIAANAATFNLQFENASTRLSVTHDNVGIGANDEYVFSFWYTAAS